jgi:hypothetical protein
MKYRDNMSAGELETLMAEIRELDNAYHENDMWQALLNEWWNMVNGNDWPTENAGRAFAGAWAELRKAALNHRGEP